MNLDDDDVENISWDTDGDNDDEVVEEVGPTNASIVAPSPSRVSEAGPSRPNLIFHFLGMGFSEEMIVKALKTTGEADTDAILDTLLTYQAIDDNSPSGNSSTLGTQKENADQDLYKDRIVSTLVDMGYLVEEAASAIDICGQNASVLELADSITAAQMAKESDGSCHTSSSADDGKKRRGSEMERDKKRSHHHLCNGVIDDDEPHLSISNPIVEIGLPFERGRKLPERILGPPYFYCEKVALAPKGVYHIEPEFVDSKFFSALVGKRGYIHNLPVANRFCLSPIPPKTIQEAVPTTRKYWPKWDPRTQLNCLQTDVASVQLVSRIMKALSGCSDPPPRQLLNYVLVECQKWNLVWVGHHKTDMLDPDEIETLLGFPRNHTRGGGLSRTGRYKALGNSYQIDTLAYHLSVLKDMYPKGMNVLSLFSGIGGAEVALHRLGIRLNTVVSVELSKVNRNIVMGWWEQTNQTGNLIQFANVHELNCDRLKHLIQRYGRFDLIIAGSPFSNHSGSNSRTYSGLDLFNHYLRILDLVNDIMGTKK